MDWYGSAVGKSTVLRTPPTHPSSVREGRSQTEIGSGGTCDLFRGREWRKTECWETPRRRRVSSQVPLTPNGKDEKDEKDGKDEKVRVTFYTVSLLDN